MQKYFDRFCRLGLVAGLLCLFAMPPALATTTYTVSSYAAVGVNEQGAPSAGNANFSLTPNLSALYFPSGTGSAQASVVYVATRTLSASATDTLVLSSGLTDALGNALVFTSVKGVFISSVSTNPGNLVVGNAGTHPFQAWFGAAASTESVPAGGRLLHDFPGAGWTVTSGSSDQLAITNSSGSGSATYTIVIWG